MSLVLASFHGHVDGVLARLWRSAVAEDVFHPSGKIPDGLRHEILLVRVLSVGSYVQEKSQTGLAYGDTYGNCFPP